MLKKDAMLTSKPRLSIIQKNYKNSGKLEQVSIIPLQKPRLSHIHHSARILKTSFITKVAVILHLGAWSFTITSSSFKKDARGSRKRLINLPKRK